MMGSKRKEKEATDTKKKKKKTLEWSPEAACSAGTRKATVLPVPVRARATTSLPVECREAIHIMRSAVS